MHCFAKRLPLLLALVVLAAPGPLRAQDEDTPLATSETGQEADGEESVIVVTATKTATSAEELASSATVIGPEEIARRQSPFVRDLLQGVPGVEVRGNGGPGQPSSVFIRGAKSEHTLVLVDGIEVNDPINPGRGFDIGQLTTENVERIEIIRGPQSVLYGSDAIGGVINIITKRGSGKPTVCGTVEGGSFGTRRYTASVSGAHKRVNYSVTASRFETDGISAASEEYPGNTEEDGVTSRTFAARVGVAVCEALDLHFFVRQGRVRGDTDNAGGAFGDDPNHYFETYYRFYRGQGDLFLLDGRWEQIFGVSYTQYDRRDYNDPDPAHPADSLRSAYHSSLLKFDWQNNFYLADWNTLTVGAETEKERGESDYRSMSAFGPYVSVFPEETARTNGYYVQDQLNIGDRFFATVGVRVDDHDRFGSETTYRIAPAYVIQETGTRLKGTYGTGFKAPSLFQLFSSFGNPDLEPEESRSWDLGVEQSFCDGRAAVGVTYFHNDYENLIDYDTGTNTYMNIGEAWSRGWEFTASAQPVDCVTVSGSYTVMETRDRSTNDDLLRRPERQASADVVYSFADRKADVGIGVVYTGDSEDMDFSTWPASRVTLDSYTLVNLNASYQFSKHCSIFARVENLFDKTYEVVKGYGTPGRGFFGGIRLCW